MPPSSAHVYIHGGIAECSAIFGRLGTAVPVLCHGHIADVVHAMPAVAAARLA